MDESKETWQTLKIAAYITASFSVSIVAIGLALGTEFAIPNERIFAIIGLHGWIPILGALVIYLLYRLFSGELFRLQTLGRVTQDMAYVMLLNIVFYFHLYIKIWVPHVNPRLWDDFYWRGELLLRPFTEFILPVRQYLNSFGEFDDFYQTGYLALFFSAFLAVAYTNRRVFHQFYIAFLLTVGFGAFTYMITPTIGPFLFEQGHNAIANMGQPELLDRYHLLRANDMAWLNANIADYLGASLAAVPSMHVAYSFLVSWGMWHCFPSFLVRIPVAFYFLLVASESVWSKWHYWIDTPAGMAVALLSLWLAQKMIGQKNEQN